VNGDDLKLFHLIQGSQSFDRIARAKIFLDLFQRSPLRPRVLLIFGDTAEAAAAKLSRDASRGLNLNGTHAPEFSYFLNYSGLDRYNRLGVHFVFDSVNGRFRYSGAAWQQILRRYPDSPEAAEARERLRKER
jgi:hypothetical protein